MKSDWAFWIASEYIFFLDLISLVICSILIAEKAGVNGFIANHMECSCSEYHTNGYLHLTTIDQVRENNATLKLDHLKHFIANVTKYNALVWRWLADPEFRIPNSEFRMPNSFRRTVQDEQN